MLTNLSDSEPKYREVDTELAELAHANRVAAMGQLSASIAHEVNQPIAAAIIDARAALRWLSAQQPDLEEVRRALDRIVKEGNRAMELLSRVRALIKKTAPRQDGLDINETICEAVSLTRSEMVRNGVELNVQLTEDLPRVQGDPVQLQQVVLNLIVNAVEAMSEMSEGPRQLQIRTGEGDPNGIFVAVRDSGPGVATADLNKIFNAYYTTKAGGLGMGLSICRSIIDAHRGRLWATANQPHGTIFQFTLPTCADSASRATTANHFGDRSSCGASVGCSPSNRGD